MVEKKVIYLSILTIFLFFSLLNAQARVGDWKALTSVMEVRDLTSLNETIYAATGGGIFEIKNNEYSVYTTIDGLEGVDLSTISVDFRSQLWIGGNSPFGFIQIYDPLNRESINNFDFGLSAILDIQFNDNTCWILFRDGQDFGLMKFIFDEDWQYRDSYGNYPATAGDINCFAVNDSIVYLGMTNGLYSATRTTNLKDPNSWNILIPSFNHEITSMVLTDDQLSFTTNTGIFEYDLSTETLYEIEFSYELELADDLFITSEGKWFTDQNKLYLKGELNDHLISDNHYVSSFVHISNQLIGGSNNGFVFIENNNNSGYSIDRFLPNTPSTGSFSAITILDDGRLVGGSGNGISIYDGLGWRNILEIKTNGTLSINNSIDYNYFLADTVGYDFGEYIADMEQGPDGLVYCAIRGSRVYASNPPRWSGGVIILDVDDPSNISTIDTTFLSYHTTSNSSIPYQVTLDIEFDNDGNLWIANPYCINGNNPIHVRSVDGTWKHYGSSETPTRISQSPSSIVFDLWGRTWVSAFQAEEANLGIYPNGGISVLSFDGNPYNPNEILWNVIDYSGTVWSLGMGVNNRLYYLTPSGLNYYDIENNYNPIIRENLNSYFPNISFGNGAGISIDSHGNIWTHSPTQGVHILLENTSYWPDINGFRTSNSPLLSDEVRDIDFDEENNLAYIATSKGVNILRIPFGKPKLDYQSVKIFPSPFYIPSQKAMKVDGLIYGSSMMITTLDGNVVRHIRSSGIEIDGDQLSWDGRDNHGDYVSTGIYLLLIYNRDGSHFEEKITVLKQ